MKLHCIAAGLLLVLFSPGLANGQLPYSGIVITKQGQFEKDIHAAVMPFTGMEVSGPVTTFGLTTGGRINVPNGLIVQIANIGEAQFRDLSTPADAEYQQAVSDHLATVASRYPKSQAYVQQMQAVIAADLQRYSNGEVRAGGVWMTPGRAAVMAKEREEREKAAMEMKETQYAAERARLAALRQVAERKRSNLDSPWKSYGAAYLASTLKEKLNSPSNFSPGAGTLSSFPVGDYFEPGVEVPDCDGCTSVLYDGSHAMSMSCLAFSNGGGLKQVVVVLPMPVKDGRCQYPDHAKAFNDFVTDIDTELGLWLPVALASARSKLPKLETSTIEKHVYVQDQIQGKACSLLLTRPEVMPGGIDYYYITLFIN